MKRIQQTFGRLAAIALVFSTLAGCVVVPYGSPGYGHYDHRYRERVYRPVVPVPVPAPYYAPRHHHHRHYR